MLVFRSLTLGLLAACFAVLLMRPVVQVRVPPTDEHGRDTPCAPSPTILDVAAGVTPAQLADAIQLAPGESIVAIDEQPVTGNIGAGLVLAAREIRSRTFLDVSIAGPAGYRRMIVLMH